MDTNQNVNETSARIAALNDEHRKSLCFVITRGVRELEDLIGLTYAVRDYDDFSEDNDPYSEHDFGVLKWYGEKVYWKIDYYTPELRGWCDPIDSRCTRVLTVMLAEEY